MQHFVRAGALPITFLTVWAGYFLLLFGAGYDSQYANFDLAIMYQFLFVAIMAGSAIAFGPSPRRGNGGVSPTMRLVVWIGLAVSAIGVSSLFVDKMLLGIDYSQGVCLARSQMTRLGEARGGVSSPFSIVGNLLSYALFAPLAVVLTQRVDRKLFWIGAAGVFVCLMAVSFVASSRSTIMLLGAFAVSMLALRVAIGNPIPKVRWSDLGLTALFVAIAGFFILSVFDCRANASHMSATQYRDKFVSHLGAAPKPAAPSVVLTKPAQTESKIEDKAKGLVGISVLYVVHSAYTFAGIISEPGDQGRILFNLPAHLLARIGVIESPGIPWALSGRFASLPGAIYHDYGFWVLVIGSLLLGLGVTVATRLAQKFDGNVLILGAAGGLFTVLLLSPIHPATEFAAFPFIGFGFFLTAGLAQAASLVRPIHDIVN